MTQRETVLRHLQAGRPLTALQALTRYGIIQLPARIWRLRQDGYPVDSWRVERNGKHFAEYRLEVGA